MQQLWTQILSVLKRGERCVRISVIETKGSTPREVGASIIMLENGQFLGTIGGGNLEFASTEKAKNLLSQNDILFDHFNHILGVDMGQCCGGSVRVLMDVMDQDSIFMVKILAEAEQSQCFDVKHTLLDDQIIYDAMGEVYTRSHKAQENIHYVSFDALMMAEDFDQAPSYVLSYGDAPKEIAIFGSGHVGRAMMLALAPLPFKVKLIDNRIQELPKAAPNNFELVHAEAPPQYVGELTKDSDIFILTHDHDLDFEILSHALQLGHFPFVGMIGSKTKRARFISKLKKLGLSDEQIGQMTCPIGIDGINSKKPAAIAISVAADLLKRHEI